jgi:N-acylneuraminate cytidylyltransferase
MNSNFKWISHNEKKKKWPRTQDLQKYYLVNNAAFISSRKNYIFDKNRIGPKPMPIISRKYSEIDIDNKEDLLFLVKNYINIKL